MYKNITMMHGGGGAIMQQMIQNTIIKNLKDKSCEIPLSALDDAAIIDGIVFSTDSYTINPLFFPGGDIGRLSISGTVNDISVMGGDPFALACSLIIEEGFPIDDLERIMMSIHETCTEAKVHVVTGDTKVMEKKSIDKLVITTTGIGKKSKLLEHNLEIIQKYRPNYNKLWLSDFNIEKGDKIIISGTLGDHGTAILSARNNYGFDSNIKSDVSPLNSVIEKALAIGGITNIKDPTRGGLANLLNEWTSKSGIGLKIYEEKIPVKESVRTALGFLGIDYLEVGNEGKVCISAIPEKAEEILQTIKQTKEGEDAMIIGEAINEIDIPVLETIIGGNRIIPMPSGDPIPRIC
ncbi:MAG: hydrogenase expression/formation protein HypE [Nitrososphaeraceae archaeon]|nr:hydrogenase expression/formation protein HypE [Nitrososphaeraceae archaeon]